MAIVPLSHGVSMSCKLGAQSTLVSLLCSPKLPPCRGSDKELSVGDFSWQLGPRGPSPAGPAGPAATFPFASLQGLWHPWVALVTLAVGCWRHDKAGPAPSSSPACYRSDPVCLPSPSPPPVTCLCSADRTGIPGCLRAERGRWKQLSLTACVGSTSE